MPRILYYVGTGRGLFSKSHNNRKVYDFECILNAPAKKRSFNLQGYSEQVAACSYKYKYNMVIDGNTSNIKPAQAP